MALIPKESSYLALGYGWNAIPRTLRRYWWWIAVGLAVSLAPIPYAGWAIILAFFVLPTIVFCCLEAGADIKVDRTAMVAIAFFILQNAVPLGLLTPLYRAINIHTMPRPMYLVASLLAMLLSLYVLAAIVGLWSSLAFYFLTRGTTKSIDRAYRDSWAFANGTTWKRLVYIGLVGTCTPLILALLFYAMHLLAPTGTPQHLVIGVVLSIVALISNMWGAAASVALATTCFSKSPTRNLEASPAQTQ